MIMMVMVMMLMMLIILGSNHIATFEIIFKIAYNGHVE